MLLNILQCTRKPLTTKNYLASNHNSDPDLHSYELFAKKYCSFHKATCRLYHLFKKDTHTYRAVYILSVCKLICLHM